MNHPVVTLASTSRYRAELLRRLLIEFAQQAPGTDETALPGESPDTRAMRLAEAKTRDAAANLEPGLVIGSDQVAALGARTLDKPGSIERAHEQLAASSGQCVVFHTALCLLDSRNGRIWRHLDRTQVRFRQLDDAEIARYVAVESPLDCAGSFKCEGLGISLFEAIDSSDPTALIGLPLIALARQLREAGLPLP